MVKTHAVSSDSSGELFRAGWIEAQSATGVFTLNQLRLGCIFRIVLIQ
jgi:hypothetical protein